MKAPRDCVPKGTVPLFRDAVGVHEMDGHPFGLRCVGQFGYEDCIHIGFRVLPEMVDTFKHERSPGK